MDDIGKTTGGAPSSKPPIKRGPNRGRRHREQGGRWVYLAGYDCDVGENVKRAHWEWVRGLERSGVRMGRMGGDGVVSYYRWVSGQR